jgi:hypothetical protein
MDDPAAQLLQMFHEGHAQHALFFLLLRRCRRRWRRRRWSGRSAGRNYFGRRRWNQLARGRRRLLDLGRSFSLGRRYSLLLVVHL